MGELISRTAGTDGREGGGAGGRGWGRGSIVARRGCSDPGLGGRDFGRLVLGGGTGAIAAAAGIDPTVDTDCLNDGNLSPRDMFDSGQFNLSNVSSLQRPRSFCPFI